MKKIGIIGHFGKGLQLANGQTVKTQVVHKALSDIYGDKAIETIDTHGGIKFLIRMPFLLYKTLLTCKNIVIMPGSNGLRTITPVLVLLNLLFHRPIHYITIGGWLPEMLSSKRWLLKLLHTFTCIYPETNSVNESLHSLGLTNTKVMPNFKFLQKNINDKPCMDKPYRLCTFSRVTKEKGIEEAIYAVKEVNKQLGHEAFILDIYGQIDNKEWFDNIMKNCSHYITYKGCIQYGESTSTLKKYFALLFPTYYDGECFAGTIIDAFFAALPVFASDWHDNANIIKDKETGLIFKAKSKEAITQTLLYAYNHSLEIKNMRCKCRHEAEKYEPAQIIKILINEIEHNKQ